MVRIDKTLSGFWDLKMNPATFTIDQLKEVATMAISALHKQEIEHEKFVNASYEAVKKEEEKVNNAQELIKLLYNDLGSSADNDHALWMKTKEYCFKNKLISYEK